MFSFPKILVANFFPAFFPPTSGGEQRYYYLYHYLSTQFDITLLSPTYPDHPYQLVEHSPTFREHRIPKDPIFGSLHHKLDQQQIGPECSALVVALASGYETLYEKYFQEIVNNIDLIIHESPYTLPYDRTLHSDGKPRIYNSYNVEFKLASQILHNDIGRAGSEFVKYLEKELVDNARLVLATCQEEADAFVDEFNINRDKTGIAPNGFEPAIDQQTIRFSQAEKKPFAIFMGSAHPPNVEAALFIVNQLAPYLPKLDFHLMGSVCKSLANQQLPKNVVIDGFVSEEIKTQLLCTSTIALNPMFAGAGTNLKMLDYMAAAAPIVTTPIGARGLSLSNGVEAFIVDKEDFLATILKIFNEPSLAKQVGYQAQKVAYDCYTWRSIANSVAPLIRKVLDKSEIAIDKNRHRKKLLVLNDFPVFQAEGGGQVRIKELLIEIGKEYNITLLCLGNLPEPVETKITENVLEVCIPKTQAHCFSEVEKNALSPTSINDVIAADHVFYNSLFMDKFDRYVATAEIILFEHPYLASLLSFIPESKPVIYSSLNCEASLKKEILKSRADYPILINRVQELEEKLLRRANLVVCVSEADQEFFKKSFPNQNYVVIENGVRCDRYKELPDNILNNFNKNCSLALFVGSAHLPNVDAARYILDVLAPALPEVLFGIIGSVGDALKHHVCPKNVSFLGILDEDIKNCLMKNAVIAVNPLFSGGGSSLKIPDFFAAGLPVISTEVGIRGYSLLDGVHYLSANSSNFPQRVRHLLADEPLRSKLRQNATNFVKMYTDWPVLGRRYREALGQLLSSHPQKRLLVVSYRFTDPPLGGAEAYLNNVLRELSKRGEFSIDLVTYAVGKLTNKWHFSAEYEPASTQNSKPDYLDHLLRFPLNAPDHSVDFSKCRKLFSLWAKESLEQGREFIDLFTYPILLGGWNFPEKQHNGSVARWSSYHAEIFIGTDAKSIRMQGTLNGGSMAICVAGINLCNEENGVFDFQVKLPKGAGLILSIHVKNTSIIENDLRELGAFFTLIEIENQDGWQQITLDEDYATQARAENVERWVHSLIRQTEQRHPHDDRLFLEVRGPHSSALMAWLDQNIAAYDVVLAQGVPFASSVDTLDVAKRHGVPCAILPHFHMEDKYYHWRSFYQTFRMADLVLAFPNLAKNIFFDYLGSKNAYVIGGAADLSEFTLENLKVASEVFIQAHRFSRPFMLVLGRKAGGKNYRLAIEALAQLNRKNYAIDLVMIGPDDDGVMIDVPNVYYLGMQPREVVIGALACCLCVVNMSSSESFGIVLIESWLAEKPVIVQRNCAAFSELVHHGENGFLVETPEEILESVIQYLSEPDYAKQCGKAGLEIAKSYTWFSLAESINNYFVSLVNKEARI